MRQHEPEESCWCKPICIFNAGKNYGKVFVHKDPFGQYTDPGADTLMEAMHRAIEELEDVNIVEVFDDAKNN